MEKEEYYINGKTILLEEHEAWKYGKRGYKRLKVNARNRGIPFEISTTEELVSWWINTPDECYWCKVSNNYFNSLKNKITNTKINNPLIIKLKKWLRNYHSKYLTYDRVNSEGPYATNNLVKSCPICNNVKGFLIEPEDMLILGPKILQRIKNVLKGVDS